MNRKVGYGVVTTNDLICVDERGRTARHIEGKIRVDYMSGSHYWLIMDDIHGMGDSFPNPDDKKDSEGVDCGQLWIPDTMVASIRWFTQEW